MVLLCAILLCISALFVCTSFNIRRQVRQTVEETNANALEFWSSNTENRLSMLYEHVYELLVSLYNNTGASVRNAPDGYQYQAADYRPDERQDDDQR